jgi:NitT/TauT family transport system substrate-binding protein
VKLARAIIGLVLAANFLAARHAAADPVTFRVGQSSPANTFLAIWMAKDAGLYEANGLKVEVVAMAGGRDIADAFASGRIDAMHIGLSSVVRANAAGADLRAFGSLSNVIRFALFGAPGVKVPADLKGGTIGISSLGSESDVTTTIMLAQLGLTRADVAVRELGTHRLGAVRSGAVTATALNEPDRSLAYAAGLTALVDLAPQRIPWLFTGLVARRADIAAHRDTLLRFLKATIEGNRLALADEPRAKAVLRKELHVEDNAIIDINYADFKEQAPVDARIDPEGARAVIDKTSKAGASRNVEDYIDLSLLDAVKPEGLLEPTSPK